MTAHGPPNLARQSAPERSGEPEPRADLPSAYRSAGRRDRRSLRWRWPTVLAALGAVLVGGCDDGRPSERQLLSEGRRAFVSAGCGACHTIASVHAHGQIGPDFDTSEPLNRDQIRSELDYGDGVMPSFHDRLTAGQLDAVIEFVFQTLHDRR